jgi:transcriptional regulator with XRE-family HTH domain
VSKSEHDDDPFPGRLVQARELRHLSQVDLAKKAGIPASSVSHFEAGTRKPSFDNLRRIANVLDISTDFLLGRVAKPELAAEGDRLHRDAQRLNDQDRDLAQAFIEMLGKRAKKD